MKKFIILGLLLASTQAFSNVISKVDSQKKCTKYTVLSGDEERTRRLLPGEKLVINKAVYGLAFKNMSIDFNNRSVSFDLIANVMFGFNTKLVAYPVILMEQNPDFHELSNQVNQKLVLFSSICLGQNNEVIYGDFSN